MEEFEKILGYKFINKDLLTTALTHKSYSNEHNVQSYERLEFLGDSVLSIIISEYLYEKLSQNDEGDLSRIRSNLVCEESLADVARKLGFKKFLILGNGEEKTGNNDRNSILSDIFESVLAAIYLDSGMDTARKYVLNVMKDKLNSFSEGEESKDFKTKLQEAYQKKHHGRDIIEYKTVGESGPDHMKTFEVELLINGKVIACGQGKTKKESEQSAAENALKTIRV